MSDVKEVIPTIGEPALSPEYHDYEDRQHCMGARWALSWGCQLTFGYSDTATDEEGFGVGPEELHVTVSMSDEDHRNGITVRKVTREQVRAYARHLLALVGDEDGAL